ncbi:hypothetical protein [Metabacillus fastidiosus]|uniref:hypothetical protein n=1 Tax=Metabacillus fastidiosus TaxID=1458 RepID=UPI003D298AB4
MNKKVNEVKDKWLNSEELSIEDISLLFGALEAYSDRFMAIENIASEKNIDQYCTPLIEKKLNAIKELSKVN